MTRSSAASACNGGRLVATGVARSGVDQRLYAQDSAVYADLVVRRIVAAVERLRTFPESGRIVPERGDPVIREVIVRPYRVVYRLLPGTVQIITVFHASRLLSLPAEG